MNKKLLLYNGPTSPFGRKVKIVSIVHEIDLEEKIINVYEADFLDKSNPLRKIPTLLINNLSIIDSDNICLYFDSIGNNKSLFPKRSLLANYVSDFTCKWINGICFREIYGTFTT